MVEPCIISQLYIAKQLEYVTKDHLGMHSIQYYLNLKQLYSLVFCGITILNNIILLITRSGLYVAQASSSFKRLDMCTPMHTTPTFITEAFHFVTYVRLF